jgi:hypothetical protein
MSFIGKDLFFLMIYIYIYIYTYWKYYLHDLVYINVIIKRKIRATFGDVFVVHLHTVYIWWGNWYVLVDKTQSSTLLNEWFFDPDCNPISCASESP